MLPCPAPLSCSLPAARLPACLHPACLQVYNPKNKLQQVFVITLGRAGEDNRSFRLTDIDSTLSGFAGADYIMQVGAGAW